MLRETNIPTFEYDENPASNSRWWKKQDIFGQHCSKCKKLFSEYELIPVKGFTHKMEYYCPDCIVGNVGWCNICGEAFVLEDPAIKNTCKECAEDICTKTSKTNSNQ